MGVAGRGALHELGLLPKALDRLVVAEEHRGHAR
jgi:hypothetical protein